MFNQQIFILWVYTVCWCQNNKKKKVAIKADSQLAEMKILVAPSLSELGPNRVLNSHMK